MYSSWDASTDPPTLIAGPKEAILAICGDDGLDLGDASIADTEGAESARAAVKWVRSGAALMLMKGQIATPDLRHAMLDPDKNVVGHDTNEDAFPMLNPDGPFCLTRPGIYTVLVSVEKGAGRYALQVWGF